MELTPYHRYILRYADGNIILLAKLIHKDMMKDQNPQAWDLFLDVNGEHADVSIISFIACAARLLHANGDRIPGLHIQGGKNGHYAIKILEELGGNNTYEWTGSDEKGIYYIDSDNNIRVTRSPDEELEDDQFILVL